MMIAIDPIINLVHPGPYDIAFSPPVFGPRNRNIFLACCPAGKDKNITDRSQNPTDMGCMTYVTRTNRSWRRHRPD
jgi:hypothetical protein